MPGIRVGLVSQDIEARDPGTRAGVFLQAERFDLVMRILGCRSETAAARMLDVDPKTIYLARTRGVIGEKFIAAVLAVMREHKDKLAELGISAEFEEVFILGVKNAA